MKKLLFSASLVLLTVGCGNKDAVEAKKAKDGVSVEESKEPHFEEKSSIEKSNSINEKEPQPENNMTKPAEEPAHNAPDQSRIDSIKAAKQKGKK